MSIHLLSIAEDLADRIGIINHGKIISMGTLAELRENLAQDGSLEDIFLSITGGDDVIINSEKSTDAIDGQVLP
jgi:ABC-2 type transport system ATP-binding protein